MKQEFQQAPLQVFVRTLDSEMEKCLISSGKSMNCAHCFASAPPEENTYSLNLSQIFLPISERMTSSETFAWVKFLQQ